MAYFTPAAAIAGAATQQQRKRMCLECNVRPGKARGLCYRCWENAVIRARWPALCPKNQVRVCRQCGLWNAERDGLCRTCLTPPCPHGSSDGICPACERQQRAAMGIVNEEEDEE